jgi:hypothetical protein
MNGIVILQLELRTAPEYGWPSRHFTIILLPADSYWTENGLLPAATIKGQAVQSMKIAGRMKHYNVPGVNLFCAADRRKITPADPRTRESLRVRRAS